jgi:hypothetical protein
MNELNPTDILNLNPYSPLVWGFIVLMLLTAIRYFYNQVEKKQLYIDNLIEKTHAISDAVMVKLQDIKNHNENKDEAIISALEDIKRRLDNLKL